MREGDRVFVRRPYGYGRTRRDLVDALLVACVHTHKLELCGIYSYSSISFACHQCHCQLEDIIDIISSIGVTIEVLACDIVGAVEDERDRAAIIVAGRRYRGLLTALGSLIDSDAHVHYFVVIDIATTKGGSKCCSACLSWSERSLVEQ